MPELLDSVADLTHLRDRDDLQSALATVMFAVVAAKLLTVWQLARREGTIRLHRRLELRPNTPAVAHDVPIDASDMPLLEVHPALAACEAAGKDLGCQAADGLWSNVFPVFVGREVACLVDIVAATRLHEEKRRLMCGLLRIYSNHLTVLEYSDRDQLTGLLNRRTFEDAFTRVVCSHIERQQRSGAPCKAQLAVVDIDFFKRINDQFGHPFGDEVLVLLARLMGASFREVDRLYRFGGEEFVVILPGTNLHDAEIALERFRAIVENFNFSQVGHVTVSIGFTGICIGDTGSSAFGRADEALYVAKQGGRNQVRCHEMLIAAGALTDRTTEGEEVEMF